MEKILVAINGRQGAWEAVSHAFSLAKRVNVQLNILLVVASGANRGRTPMDVNGRQEVKRRIDLLIESALADGLQVNYFIAEGNFEEEVINFINCNKITLLVYEAPIDNGRSASKHSTSLRNLRHRIACKIEVVVPRKHTTEPFERIA
ncbi:MAG: universal stress protein [Desulfoprunum sp.]|jgi:K+-sensing histidine kinase KdpD|uniref:universal stress protein n=1 Tax=Desulfoprunum sp. TaxID=2020866 RepID=UPI00052DCA2F|nr:hypothetical protein JT06_02065 [Desulfobulbus sp. Tol-SR]